MHVSLQSFTITNSLYNLPNDEFITVQVIQTPDPDITEPELDPQSIEEYTFELPKGTWQTEDIFDRWNSEETPIQWFYDENQNKVNLSRPSPDEDGVDEFEHYTFEYAIVDGSAYLLYMLGLESDGEVQEEPYVGPFQVYLTNHFNVYLRCNNLSIPTQVCGWTQSGENILARIPIETALGSVYHYEPQNTVSSSFRSGALAALQLEILREDGTLLEMEPDTEWTVTLEFTITRGDTAATAPTSYQNAQAMNYTTESTEGHRDFLARRFDDV